MNRFETQRRPQPQFNGPRGPRVIRRRPVTIDVYGAEQWVGRQLCRGFWSAALAGLALLLVAAPLGLPVTGRAFAALSGLLYGGCNALALAFR